MKSSQRFSPWIQADLSRWDALSAGRQPEKIRKDTSLYYQRQEPQYLYIVRSGRFRVTCYLASGKERQLYIAEVGCLIGEQEAVSGMPYQTFPQAIINSEVYRIPRLEFLAAMENDPLLTQNVMRMMCQKYDVLFSQLIGYSTTQAKAQICRVIVNLTDQYGIQKPQGIQIGIRVTHSDIAAITGISRVTVANTFSQLSQENILTRQDGRFLVRDLPRLLAYAGEEN